MLKVNIKRCHYISDDFHGPDNVLAQPGSHNSTEQGGFGPVGDLTQREQRIRDNEILLSSFATRIAQNSVPVPSSVQSRLSTPVFPAQSTGNFRPSLQSVFGNPVSQSWLIDPNSDPLLSSSTSADVNSGEGPSRGAERVRDGQLLGSVIPTSSAFSPRFLAPPIRSLTSPPPIQRVVHSSDMRISDDTEIALDQVIRSAHTSSMATGISSAVGTSVAFSDIARPHTATTDMQENLTRQLFTSGITRPSATQVAERLTAVSTPATSQTSVPVVFSNYFQSHLHSSASSSVNTSASRQGVKPFQSIRERLQASTPLTSVKTGSCSSASSDSKILGIPKVTVIMSSVSEPYITVSLGGKSSNNTSSKDSTKKPSSQMESSHRLSAESLPSCSYINSSDVYSSSELARNSVVINSSQSNSTATSVTETFASDTNTKVTKTSAYASRHNVDNSVQSVRRWHNGPVDIMTDSQESATQNVGDNVNSEDTSSTSSLPQSDQVSVIPILNSTPVTCQCASAPNCHISSVNSVSQNLVESQDTGPGSVVASTSSQSALFENIIHASEIVPETANTTSNEPVQSPHGATTLPSQLQNWQNRTRYMSIMGPYLESRGINPVVSIPPSSARDRSANNLPVMSHESAAGLPSANPHSRDQASSDTETELSTHLSSSGAYFLPITEDHRRSVSSASLNRNTDSAGLRQFSLSAESTDSTQGQSSRSSSQGQDIELVVDHNENYTTNRNSGQGDTQSISLRSQDSNNNSIHIVTTSNETQANLVPSSLEERSQDYLQMRDSFLSMTDQIEREMNELNRRINALRDSFNQSIRSLRQDRRRYENMDNLLPDDTATNTSGPAILGLGVNEDGHNSTAAGIYLASTLC